MKKPAMQTIEYLEWAKSNITSDDLANWSTWIISDASNKAPENQFEWPHWINVLENLNPRTALSLTSLGDVAAESDAVLDYFLVTKIIDSIEENDTVLILGRKGTGKTALVRYFTEKESHQETSRAISLQNYPWKIHEQRKDHSTSEVEAYISSWQYLMAVQFATLVVNHAATDSKTTQHAALSAFLNTNYGSTNPNVSDTLSLDRLEITKTTLEPQLFGLKLGGISFEKSNRNAGRELNALTSELNRVTCDLANACGIKDLSLHFDELDRGLVTFDGSRKNMLIGLISAAIAVALASKRWSVRCRPIVYLRSDLWNELRFSDKNKITSSKKTIPLEWDSQSLKKLINERIRSQLGPDASWETITSPSLMRGSQAKWDHILFRTFMRPRDVIQFLNCTLDVTHKRERDTNRPLIITNKDITHARTSYSLFLKNELDDEIGPHWSTWDEALTTCSAISTITFQRHQFVDEYNKRKSKENNVSADDALNYLYQYSVIGYESRSGYGGSSWIFNYLNPESGWDSNATRFKVHAGLKEYAKLREERASGNTSDDDEEE